MKNWIAKAMPKSHKGALHSDLGVPQGQKIPKMKIAAAVKRGGKIGMRAKLAQTFAKMK